MTQHTDNTLRLIFPQWQGGNNGLYHLGARLLNWLAPVHDGPTEEVDVGLPDGRELRNEQGILARTTLLEQLRDARRKIDKHSPDRVVVIGGDCLVDLAPFAYLNERYEDDLAVLWVDAHPDIMTPEQFENGHAMVLGNLLGHGDDEFRDHVRKPVRPANVCYLGVNDASPWEQQEMARHGLNNVAPETVAERGAEPVLEWFRSTGAKHLAIHFDLDALDPTLFRALLFAKPDATAETFEGIAQGKLGMAETVKVLCDVAKEADVVGLGIAEHLPWDAQALKTMLDALPLIGQRES
ncbi:arginase family protein [Marinobacter bohaiensis]|uniref:arginase family protein n=1 Tax=Marinobacter bohaiensis TaxID=2201898 RepID=UPI000DAEC808|nr:arginase family protein [Marinobacter bohaiensis]